MSGWQRSRKNVYETGSLDIKNCDLVKGSFLFLILALGTINMLFPQSFYLFGVNYSSFLPIRAQLSWLLVCLSMMLCEPWIDRLTHKLLPSVTLWILAGFALWALVFFQVEYASLQGDGAFGPPPLGGTTCLSKYPGPDGRLAAFLCQSLSYCLPESVGFPFKYAWLQSGRSVADAWVMLTLAMGWVLVCGMTVGVSRLACDSLKKMGILLMLLSSPPMLNFFGHFDSYAIPIACVGLWFLALLRLDVAPTICRQDGLFFLFTTILAAWAHPTLILLGLYGMLYSFTRFFPLSRKIPDRLWLTACSVGIGFLPALFANARNPMMLNIELFPCMLHEKISSLVLVSFPALVMGMVLLGRQQETRSKKSPPLVLTMWIATFSTMITFFTMAAHLGMADEFLYSIRGAILLGAILLLCYRSGCRSSTFLYGGILSLYLFGSAVFVNSGDLLLSRYRRLIPYDRSVFAQYYSPYSTLGLCIPVTTAKDRRQRLETFKEGFVNPLPCWEKYANFNRLYYTAWCYEFDQREEGREQLRWAIQQKERIHTSFPLLDLWVSGTRLTHRYKNRAYQLIREDSRQILMSALNRTPDDPYLSFLLHALDKLETQAPTGTGSFSLIDNRNM